jgi:ribosomal protein S19E (S16A)
VQSEEYRRAQLAIAELKSAVVAYLERAQRGATNAEIGRSLGIYGGHKGHEGHISRTVLGMLEGEGVVQQNEADRTWTMRLHSDQE